MTIFRTLLALILAFAVALPASAREWLRAETPGFVVYSDGFPHELQRWAKKLEMFDALLRLRLDRPGKNRGTKLTVYLLKDGKDVGRLANQKYMTGFYTRSSEGSFAVAHRRPGYFKHTLSGQATLFHEYTHHFMYRHFPSAYPAWYREGFAEYTATASFDIDGHYTFGSPATYREKHLRKAPLPIEALLLGDAEALPPKRRSAYYAWSWLLVHMLVNDPERAGQLRLYLQRFGTGAGPRRAASSFGDLDTLETDLKAYADAMPRLPKSARPITYDSQIPVTALDACESRLVDLRLLRLAKDHLETARTGLRELAAACPADADVLLELALAERDVAKAAGGQDWSLAEAAVNRALAADPAHPRANVLKAQLMTQRLSPGPDGNLEGWVDARRRLVGAMTASPKDPLPRLALFRSYLRQRSRIPGIAHEAIREAFALQPEASDIRMAWTVSLAMRGQIDEARSLARVLAYDPHGSASGERVLATIERLRAGSGQGAVSERDIEEVTDTP